MTKHNRLAWYRWEWQDPYRKDKWTACTVSVYDPSFEYPFVSVLVSIANGGGKVLYRCASVAEAKQRTGMPAEAGERLMLAETKAIDRLDAIKKDLRLLFDVKKLPEGVKLVRTDTGEVIAEVEKYLKEGK